MPRTVRQDSDPSNEIFVDSSPAATFSAREDVMSRMKYRLILSPRQDATLPT